MSEILLGFLDPDHSGRYSDLSASADVFLRQEPDEEEDDDEDDGKNDNDDDDNNDDDGDGDDGYSE